MQCQHSRLGRQCSNEAVFEGLCKKHLSTCSSDNCSLPTTRKYCRKHECAQDGCNSNCMPNKGYCDKHRCLFKLKSDRCKMERSKSGYCENHTCKMPKCQKAREVHGGYCKKHGCEAKIKNDYCGNAQNDRSKYCDKHSCADPKCDAFIDTDGSCCSKHGCVMLIVPHNDNAANVGNTVKVNNAMNNKDVLSKTQINARTRNMHADQNVKFKPKSRHVKHVICGAPRSNGKHCKDHTCVMKECKKGKMECGLYCEKHGCLAEMDDGVPCGAKKKSGKYCEEHTCMICSQQGRGGMYCKNHGCNANVNGVVCNAKKKDGDYCQTHTCEYCNQQCGNGPYCEEHGCKAKMTNGFCGLTRLDETELCTNHTCTVPECKKKANKGYCERHGCPKCGNYEEHGNYCKLCECSRCHNRASYGSSIYCWSCMCQYTKCVNVIWMHNLCKSHQHICIKCFENKKEFRDDYCGTCGKRHRGEQRVLEVHRKAYEDGLKARVKQYKVDAERQRQAQIEHDAKQAQQLNEKMAHDMEQTRLLSEKAAQELKEVKRKLKEAEDARDQGY